MKEKPQKVKSLHILEDYNRGRKVTVVTTDSNFNWGRWLSRNRNAMEAVEEYSVADSKTRESLRQFLGSLGIHLR
ncbi:MAG: hypothetical protein AAEJ57_02495 [Opitutales bacterium]